MEAASAPKPHALRLPKPRRVLAALPDDRLVEQVRRGDQAAFEVLYDRHSAPVLGFCRHMLSSTADAEDALQHTFIAAHADLQRRGDRELHFKAWIYTIARNRCLSMLRARRDQSSDDIEIVSDRLGDHIAERADLRALVADVQKLPDEQREALVLSELGDLSHTDIASILGCEASKVKSLVFQARTALIDRRLARETSCEEIREQIATLRGGALRRSHLRHHLDACPGCTEYREQVRRQRAMLALALPVVPSAAARHQVMTALGFGGGGTAATGTLGATGAGLAAKSGLAKIAIAAAVATGAAGSAAVVHNGGFPAIPGITSTSSSSHDSGRSGAGVSGSAANTRGSNGTTTAAQRKHQTNAAASTGASAGVPKTKDAKGLGPAGRSTKGTQNGFTPTTGESNGARAHQFAATRGTGNHTGLTKQHATKAHERKAAPVHTKTPLKATPKTSPSPKATQPAPKTAQPAPKTQTTPAPEPESTTPTGTTPAKTPNPVPGGGGALGIKNGKTVIDAG